MMIFEQTDSIPMKEHFTRHHHRRNCETLAELARIHAATLTGTERSLLTLILERDISYGAIAAAAGLSKSTVCRRYQRILKKLQVAPPPTALERTDRVIRRLYTNAGLSQTRIAARLNISRYRVRQGLERTAPPAASKKNKYRKSN